MFQGFADKTVDFMWNLRFNNNKSWFEDHKEEYKAVLDRPMHELAQEVYTRFMENREELNLSLRVSRIYRDARRPNIHGPYKDHLWFTIRQLDEEWTDKPVFWFELAPENWSYGLGYYSAKPLTMEKLRARIDNQPKPLRQLNDTLSAQSEFVLEGTDYARSKCDPGQPLAAWYNKRTFSLIHEEGINEAVFSSALAERITQGFEFLLPYYRYFETLDKDPDPRA